MTYIFVPPGVQSHAKPAAGQDQDHISSPPGSKVHIANLTSIRIEVLIKGPNGQKMQRKWIFGQIKINSFFNTAERADKPQRGTSYRAAIAKWNGGVWQANVSMNFGCWWVCK